MAVARRMSPKTYFDVRGASNAEPRKFLMRAAISSGFS
jgi:hypothetical protein